MQHGDIGNRGVESLHERGHGDRNGDDPGIGSGPPRVMECECRRGRQVEEVPFFLSLTMGIVAPHGPLLACGALTPDYRT